MNTRKADKIPPAESPGDFSKASPRILAALLILAVVTFVVFQPLTNYFFAQDDFTLLLQASSGPGSSLNKFFSSETGQFRPLTKTLYFKIMYGLFGLNAPAYHIVSLIIHILNSILFYILLRKFKLPHPPSLITTALFAMSMSFINIVAWISCIQQLLGQLFALSCLIFGIISIDKKSFLCSAAAVLSYILALLSIEQTAGIPLILFAYAYGRRSGSGRPFVSALASVRLPLAVMIAYFFFMFAWKGFPAEGPYRFHFGINVWDNFLTYTHWAYDFSARLPFVINRLNPGLTVSHLFILGLVLLNLARGRHRTLAVSGIYYMATIAPVLFLKDHTYFTHTYIPSFAVMLILAWAIEDLFCLTGAANTVLTSQARIILFLIIPTIAFTQVRANERDIIRESYPLPKNYILRRELVAANAYRDIKKKRIDLPPHGKFFMVYLHEPSWYQTNVIEALGNGNAVKLFYDNPELDIFFHLKGDTLDTYSAADSQILFYDYMGHFKNEEEIGGQGASIGRIQP